MRQLAAITTACMMVAVAAAVAVVALSFARSADVWSASSGSSASASSKPFYVDCRLPNSGDGSRLAPWNSSDWIRAHGPFAPGDHILLARNSSCSGRIVPSGSGTSSKPITIGAYGDGSDPTIRGGGTPEQTGTVQLTNLHDWTIQDLHVSNESPSAADGVYRAGVLVLNTTSSRLRGITIQRLSVDQVTSDPGWRDGIDPHEYGGIAVVTRSADRHAGFDDIRIIANTVARVGRAGIVTWNASYPDAFDHRVTIADNSVKWADGDSILMYGTDGGSIARNMSAFGGSLPACPACRSDPGNTASAGIWPTRAKNVVVDGNEVYGEQAEHGDGQGLDVDVETTKVLVQRNYVHDNEGGGVLICGAAGTTVRANVFQNNGGAAFVFNCTQPSTGITISNNDVFSDAAHPAAIVRTVAGRGASSVSFTNNIVSTATPAAWDWPSAVATGNNTLCGAHDASEPPDSTVNEVSPLIAIGSGRYGMGSLGGYEVAPGRAAVPSTPLDGFAIDLFGRAFDPTAPGRGATVAQPAG